MSRIKFPTNPPYPDSESYGKKFGNGKWFGEKIYQKLWYTSGLVMSWNTKEVVSLTMKEGDISTEKGIQNQKALTEKGIQDQKALNEIKIVTETKCFHNKALVRGDGKILSTVDTYPINCDSCSYFAIQHDGQLKGIDALGMYEYK